MTRPFDTEAPTGLPSPLLQRALFDFEAAPGRYPLALREPRILFDNCRAVLVAAARRGMGDLSSLQVDRLQSAAIFFVRTALFRSAADHYTLMGLQLGCSSKQLSDHYRLLMRLIHPDFASANNVWPREAAARINQAHDILTSPTRRAEYDESLSRGLNNPLGANARPAFQVPASRAARAEKAAPRKWPLAATVAGAVGALLLLLQQPMGPNADGDSPLSLVVPVPSKVALPVATASSTLTAVVLPGPMSMKFETLLATVIPVVKREAPQLPAAPPQAGFPVLSDKTVKLDRSTTSLLMSEPPRNTASRAMPADYAMKFAAPLSSAPPPLPVSAGPVTAALQAALAPALTTAPATAPPTALTVVAAQPAQAAGVKADLQPSTVPSLADAQPILSQLIQAMQSGRGEDMLNGLDRSLRQSSGAVELVLAYNHLVGGSRAIRLGAVQLKSRPLADRLVIDGVVPLVLQDQGQPAPIRELRLRALFTQRGGQAVLTELSAGESRP